MYGLLRQYLADLRLFEKILDSEGAKKKSSVLQGYINSPVEQTKNTLFTANLTHIQTWSCCTRFIRFRDFRATPGLVIE